MLVDALKNYLEQTSFISSLTHMVIPFCISSIYQSLRSKEGAG